MEDFHQAIKDIEPSALREIYVEVLRLLGMNRWTGRRQE